MGLSRERGLVTPEEGPPGAVQGRGGPPESPVEGGPSPGRTIALAVAAVAIGQGFARFSFGLLIPAMERDVLGSFGRAGVLGTMNVAAYLIGVIAVAMLARRVHPVRLLRVGLAGTVVGIFVLAVAPGYGTLLVGMAVAGFSSAGVWIPLTAIVTSAVTERRRGIAMGAVVAGVGISIIAAGQLVKLVQAVAGDRAWRQVWAIEGAAGLIVLVLVLLGLKPQERLEKRERDAARPTLRGLPGWPGITGTYTAFGLGYILYVSYLVSALESDAGFSAGHASNVYSVLGLTSAAGGILVGRLSDRVGRRAALVGCCLALAGCAGLVLTGSEPWAALSAAAFGLLMTGTGAVVAAYVGDHLDAGGVGAAFGAITLPFGVMQAIGPSAGGWIADRTGSFSLTFIISAAAFLVSAGAAWTMPSRPRPQALQRFLGRSTGIR